MLGIAALVFAWVVTPRMAIDTFPDLTPPVLVVGTLAPGLAPLRHLSNSRCSSRCLLSPSRSGLSRLSFCNSTRPTRPSFRLRFREAASRDRYSMTTRSTMLNRCWRAFPGLQARLPMVGGSGKSTSSYIAPRRNRAESRQKKSPPPSLNPTHFCPRASSLRLLSTPMFTPMPCQSMSGRSATR